MIEGKNKERENTYRRIKREMKRVKVGKRRTLIEEREEEKGTTEKRGTLIEEKREKKGRGKEDEKSESKENESAYRRKGR